jgi:hypothetical protein
MFLYTVMQDLEAQLPKLVVTLSFKSSGAQQPRSFNPTGTGRTELPKYHDR